MSLEKFLATHDASGEHEPECLSNAMFPVRAAMASVGYPPCICDQLRIAAHRVKTETIERISAELLRDVEIRWRSNAIERVRDLHQPFNNNPPVSFCRACKGIYPCPTIQALDCEQT